MSASPEDVSLTQANQTVHTVKPHSRYGKTPERRGDWLRAVQRALKRYDKNGIKRGRALYEIAMRLVEDALEGKEYAIREISERLDGKIATGDHGGMLKVIVLTDFEREPDSEMLTLSAYNQQNVPRLGDSEGVQAVDNAGKATSGNSYYVKSDADGDEGSKG